MNRVKELREKHNLKQKELAEKLNVSQGTLSNWERGVHNPDNESLAVLSQIFNVSIDYLLCNQQAAYIQLPSELDNAYFKVLKDAKDSGVSPMDLELALDFLKRARQRDDLF